jgi:hypothetical protein
VSLFAGLFLLSVFFSLQVLPIGLAAVVTAVFGNNLFLGLLWVALAAALLVGSFAMFGPRTSDSLHVYSAVCFNLFLIAIDNLVGLRLRRF